MKIKELINELKKCNQDKEILLSCDEELSVLFEDIQIGGLQENNGYVIWGNSGSERWFDEEKEIKKAELLNTESQEVIERAEKVF